jgi:hypothetical protein
VTACEHCAGTKSAGQAWRYFGAEDSHLLVAGRKVRFDPSTPAACAQDDLRFSRLNETAVVLVAFRAGVRVEFIFTL